MREFYRAHASDLEVLADAMTIGWTQNVAILEAGLTIQERVWYIQSVRQLKWSRLNFQRKLEANAHMELSQHYRYSILC